MSPAIVQEIQQTNRIFEEAVRNRTIDDLDRVYTANARILPPGAEMISGRENIKSFWRGTLENMNIASVKLETVDFELLGDTGVEIGRATRYSKGAPEVRAKYVIIWKRESGAWKWHADIWNLNA
jgi:ketosteroid isomerase-like protein